MKMKDDKKRMNVTMSEELYELIKKRADSMGVSIPSVVVFYAYQGIRQEEAISSLAGAVNVLSD